MFALYRETISTFLTISVCILGVGLMQFPRMQNFLNSRQTATLEALEREIQSEHIRLNFLKQTPSFGYNNLIADWVYLNFLQYFGDEEARAKTDYSASIEYFEVILGHDPRFLDAYLGLSASNSMYAGQPESSIELMAQSLQFLSPKVPERAYYVWRYKAIDELLFLGDAKATKKSLIKTVDWASTYSDEESKNVANISRRTVKFLSSNPNSKNARISTWVMVLNNGVDKKTQKRAIKEIEALGGKIVKTPEGTNQIIFPPKD
jgi:tetratricopeptide (TPR) repeat protein